MKSREFDISVYLSPDHDIVGCVSGADVIEFIILDENEFH